VKLSDAVVTPPMVNARRPALLHPAAKPLLFAVCTLPFAWLFFRAAANALGPNPAEALIRGTGDWVLRFLCLTLAVTPLRHLTGQHALARFRRMLGLFAFFYLVLHFLAYAWLDMGFDAQAIVRDIPKRPFALVGFAAFVLLIPLAATSTNAMVKRLGARRWQRLHYAVYAIGTLGVVHYWWLVKKDITQPAIFAAVLAVLLGFRVVHRLRAG